MTSILTNTAAMSALSNLTATQRQLSKTQAQVSSGLAVGTASDNAAYWSIATVMRGNSAALDAVGKSLSLVGAVTSVASSALGGILTSLNRLKADVVTASQSGTSSASVQSDVAAMQASILTQLSSASFNGVNLLYSTTTADEYVTQANYYDDITDGQYSAGFQGSTEHSYYRQDRFTDPISGQVYDDSYTTMSLGTVCSTGPAQVASNGDDVVNTLGFGTLPSGPSDLRYVSSYGQSEVRADIPTSPMNLLTVSNASYTLDASTIFSDQRIHSVTTTQGTPVYSGVLGDPISGVQNYDGSSASIIGFDLTRMSQAKFSALSKGIDDVISQVVAVGTRIASVSTEASNMQTFNSALSDSLTSGIGSLVDADMNVASVRLQALQTQQQLGIQALSIANQNSQLVLKLFQAA